MDAAQFAGGSGTPGDPYQISSCVELQIIQTALTASFILTGDIDCGDCDMDGDVDIIDALQIAQFVAGLRMTLACI